MHKASPIVITYNPGKKSLGQYYNIHLFLWFLVSLLNQCVIFEIFFQFSLPPPYTKLKLGKNSGYTSPTLFVGWGEGLDLCELENAPETQKCPKTFVHDCLKKRLEKRAVLRVFKPVRVFFRDSDERWQLNKHFPSFSEFYERVLRIRSKRMIYTRNCGIS